MPVHVRQQPATELLARFARVMGLLALLAGVAAPAGAEPIVIDDDSSLDRFAELVIAYRDTSRVRWVVETDDAGARTRVLDGLAERLGPVDGHLMDRITVGDTIASTRAVPTLDGTAGSDQVRAWIDIAPPPQRACSWRVTVRDTGAPGADAEGVQIPLERGDEVPTTPGATLEVGFSGPLQSTLYAFAETTPGALRDLAAAPDIAIPVDASAAETLILVRARRPVPYLDGLRTQLGPHAGARADLGRESALTERLKNGGRGIGANIQLLDPEMIVAQAETPAGTTPRSEPETVSNDLVAFASNDLVETCLYTVTRLP
jgi:hypothetical protein